MNKNNNFKGLNENSIIVYFHHKRKMQTTLQEIRETYHIVYNYIYVLQNKSSLDELFVTYNIDTGDISEKPLEDTILVHRKKQSNTLYTINALNELIKEENNGVIDKTFSVDWEKFKNSIIVTNVEGTKKINTRVFDVIKFS